MSFLQSKKRFVRQGVNMSERQYYFLSSGGQCAGMAVRIQSNGGVNASGIRGQW